MESNIANVFNRTFGVLNSPMSAPMTYFNFDLEIEETFFCNNCLDNRLMKVKNIKRRENNEKNTYSTKEEAIYKNLPLVYELKCLQCKSKAYLVIYKNDDINKSIILYEKKGGCSAKNAPEGVKYYLNEATLARNIDAKSASMSMYRAALDYLLFSEGYTKGMLGEKIENLNKDIQESKAPKWAMDIDTEYLELIKKIGNSSIHPNKGDIKKQEEISNRLLNVVDLVFSTLLDKIYEQPEKDKKNLEILREINKKMNE